LGNSRIPVQSTTWNCGYKRRRGTNSWFPGPEESGITWTDHSGRHTAYLRILTVSSDFLKLKGYGFNSSTDVENRTVRMVEWRMVAFEILIRDIIPEKNI